MELLSLKEFKAGWFKYLKGGRELLPQKDGIKVNPWRKQLPHLSERYFGHCVGVWMRVCFQRSIYRDNVWDRAMKTIMANEVLSKSYLKCVCDLDEPWDCLLWLWGSNLIPYNACDTPSYIMWLILRILHSLLQHPLTRFSDALYGVAQNFFFQPLIVIVFKY